MSDQVRVQVPPAAPATQDQPGTAVVSADATAPLAALAAVLDQALARSATAPTEAIGTAQSAEEQVKSFVSTTGQ
jgi:hypothetical protein